jgi:hypothetical protein
MAKPKQSARRSQGSTAGTISLKLSWQSVTPWLLAVLEDSKSANAKKIARAQLMNMARIADRHADLVDELSQERATA